MNHTLLTVLRFVPSHNSSLYRNVQAWSIMQIPGPAE